MSTLVIVAGLVLVYAALLLAVWQLGPSAGAANLAGRVQRPEAASLLSRLADRTSQAADSLLRRGERSHSLSRALDLAGLRVSAPDFLVILGVVMLVCLALGALGGVLVLGIVLAVLVPVLARVVLGVLASRRRAAFARQLESSLQLIAGSLRAGSSLLRALDSLVQESDSPTREEFSRVVNQVRLGRDVSEALHETAERMDCKDFHWVTQAIAIHREVGGNLAEVLDEVGRTIRERQQIIGLIRSLSADGRLSGMVLMGLPVAIGLFLSVIQPSYIGAFFTHPLGIGLLVASVLMFVIGGVWMRRVITIEF
ncbi:type II secretion system protein F [Citricoccus sp. SGAir0253]|uniref:type II secretion system F family protein n=1 Tax=Citricoccus sp. SGAir0253 TaxID=2567881 RepID=UPI0010CD38BD|nr:type II secretion system F family protein [Citricoccus sp. SGAir0253]QCU77501.1 type II secretion system protein F [Citricoccus sp. SGAir0253]